MKRTYYMSAGPLDRRARLRSVWFSRHFRVYDQPPLPRWFCRSCKYATEVIDPPWPAVANWSDGAYRENLGYSTMTVLDIGALPVPKVLAEDSWLCCWTINRHRADAIRLTNVWDTRYRFTMTWVKPGGEQFPGGPCYNAEWIIVGSRGKPEFRKPKPSSWRTIGHLAGTPSSRRDSMSYSGA